MGQQSSHEPRRDSRCCQKPLRPALFVAATAPRSCKLCVAVHRACPAADPPSLHPNPTAPPPAPRSAAMSAFYLWNLLLFKPNLPAKRL